MTSLQLAAVVLALRSLLSGAAHCAEPDKLITIENGQIKIGVDLRQGGSICFLSDVKRGENIVNTHDLGRMIGQSHYSGPQPFGRNHHRGWKNWPWNPVSAGDVYGHPTRVIEHRNDGRTLYVKSQPMQWALNNVPGDCTFETWITLDVRAAHVRNRLTNQRADKTQYPARDQELPAVYTIGPLHRLMTYDGERPFTDAPLKEIPKQFSPSGAKWTGFRATEHWAALVDDRDWGLGVLHPGVIRFLGGFYGKPPGAGTTKDDPTGYIAPIRQEILDHNIVYECKYVLMLDTLANIRRYARDHRPPPLPDYQFAADRQHWRCINVKDTGFPIRGHLRLELEQDDPYLIGPEANWAAHDVPAIHIRAAYKTHHTQATLFWTTTEQHGFHPERSVTFTITPDGKPRTYSINLAASPHYRGTITGLRFDPVQRGAAGDWAEIVSISARK